jgi:hypothetical protein
VFLGEDVSDAAACFGAGIVWPKYAAGVVGCESADCSAKSAVEYGRVVSPCRCLGVIGGSAVSCVGDGSACDVLDQGVVFFTAPEVEARCYARLYVLGPYASMFASKDASHQD